MDIFDLIPTLFAIVIVDLSMSIDTLIAISAVTNSTPQKFRLFVFLVAGTLAVAIRIAITILFNRFVSLLPFINAILGISISIIAFRVVQDLYNEGTKNNSIRKDIITNKRPFWGSSFTIFSIYIGSNIDNSIVIAVFTKSFYLLAFGIILSAIIIFSASALLAQIVQRYIILFYIAAIVISWSSISLIIGDSAVKPLIARYDSMVPGPLFTYIEVIFVIFLIIYSLYLRNKRKNIRLRL